MKLSLLACLFAIFFSCKKKNEPVLAPSPGTPPPVETSSIFSGRRGHVVVEFNEKLWLVGGATYQEYKNDVWSSRDGIKWELEMEHAAFSPRIGHQIVKQNNKLWLMGGHGGTANDIWSSVDGRNWVFETSNATFLARGGHQVVVFNNKFWANGGITGVENGFFVGFSSDIWTSADGKKWELSSTVPFEGCFGHNVVNFKGKLWFIAGFPAENGEVWSSDDGNSWKLQVAKPGFGFRNVPSVVVYKEELWLIGGHTMDAPFGGRKNDVWSSPDGISWKQRTASAVFSPRVEHKTVVFKDTMFLIGGDSGNKRAVDELKNDVWFSTTGIDWNKAR